MKTSIKIILASLLALPLLMATPAIIFANEGEDDTEGVITQQSVQPAEQAPEKKLTEEQSNALLKRLKEHKDKFKVRLATAEQRRLVQKCTNSQGNIKSVQGRIKGYDTSHTAKYGGLAERLAKLVEKLKTQNVDTAQVEAQITELQAKSDKFKTDLAAYRQAVDDLVVMDCKADPVAFKAALENARSQLASLRQQSTDIKAYIKDTIRPTLQTIRNQLQPAEATSPTNDEDKQSEAPTGGTQ